jgi:integrase/recombinase XerD
MTDTTALARTVEPALVASVSPPADRHPAKVYLARLAPGSRRTMRDALNVLAALMTSGRCDAETIEWSAIRYQHAQAVRSALMDPATPPRVQDMLDARRGVEPKGQKRKPTGPYTAATANKMLAALRGVLREAWRLGLMTAEDHARATDLPSVKGSTLPRGRALSAGELRALFSTCAADQTAAGARDAALLAVLYGAGLRRAEAVALDLADFDPETGALTIRSGKGNRARVCYATNGAAEALTAWLKYRGEAPGPLFVPVLRGGKVLCIDRLNPQTVYDILQRRADAAGVAKFSPHDMRRTFVGDLLDAGADVATVQKLAGHASVTTTARYDRRPERTRRKAAELLHVPYTPAPER